MPSLKKITTLRLDDDLSEKLKDIANKQNRSLNNLIETILINYVEEENTKKSQTINNSNVQIGSNISYKKVRNNF